MENRRYPTTILDPDGYFWHSLSATPSQYAVMRLYKKSNGADRLIATVVDREKYGISLSSPINQDIQDKTVTECMVIMETAMLLK